jgi:di/tricarboxylate transporter
MIVEIFPLIFYSTIFGLCNLFGVASNLLYTDYLSTEV